jgi:superfamily II DNA/RNA helicase
MSDNIEVDIMKFDELGLNPKLLLKLSKLGISEPTEIQEKSIPSIIIGKDVIGESATGSGKTLAFGAGVIQRVNHGSGLQALILTPTRELAEQVKDAITKFSYKKLNILAVYGGVSITPQIRWLPQADVVIATPGRLLDHIQRRTINISRVKILVLDEADRMLDMGFIRDVEKIMKYTPKQKQTLFFSATISPRIRSLTKKYMTTPLSIAVKNQVDPSKLKQVYYNTLQQSKISLLVQLLNEEESCLSLVFCNTRRNTDSVANTLKKNGVNAIAVHGGLSQSKRMSNIKFFNSSKKSALVCTDVASRGLHIDNVSHVYNYDLPDDPKDYVHRIGRTARAGEKGKVINLVSKNDHFNFSSILKNYRFVIKSLDTPAIKKVIFMKKVFSGGGKRSFSRPRRFGSRQGGPRSGGSGRGSRSRGPRSGSSKQWVGPRTGSSHRSEGRSDNRTEGGSGFGSKTGGFDKKISKKKGPSKFSKGGSIKSLGRNRRSFRKKRRNKN